MLVRPDSPDSDIEEDSPAHARSAEISQPQRGRFAAFSSDEITRRIAATTPPFIDRFYASLGPTWHKMHSTCFLAGSVSVGLLGGAYGLGTALANPGLMMLSPLMIGSGAVTGMLSGGVIGSYYGLVLGGPATLVVKTTNAIKSAYHNSRGLGFFSRASDREDSEVRAEARPVSADDLERVPAPLH